MSRLKQFIQMTGTSGFRKALAASITRAAYPERFPDPWAAAQYLANSFSSSTLPFQIEQSIDYFSWLRYGGALTPISSPTDELCLIWFVPDWDNVWGGGHYTLFRFANYFSHQGSRNIIYPYNNQRHIRPDRLQNDLIDALVDCKVEVIIDPKILPSASAAIATTWQSAYPVRAFPFSKTKFYFMQDYESHFYPHGTESMQANNSYSFGFHGITGGNWLKERYEAHGGEAISYVFATDRSIFYPASNPFKVKEKVERIFFYGRPSTERRCFDLGIKALTLIAKEFPNIEIVIAGGALPQPLPFKATLCGNLTLPQTGDLYRTCDLGLAFSGTNLSYLPVELMASGVPVLSNKGPQVEWFCRDNSNCMLADPVPADVLRCVRLLVASQSMRQALAEGGIQATAVRTWETEMEKVFSYIRGICVG